MSDLQHSIFSHTGDQEGIILHPVQILAKLTLRVFILSNLRERVACDLSKENSSHLSCWHLAFISFFSWSVKLAAL